MKRIGLLSAGSSAPAGGYADRIEAEIRHRFGYDGTCRMASVALHDPELIEAIEAQDPRRLLETARGGVDALVGLGADAIVPCSSRLQAVTELLTPMVPVLAMHEAVGAALRSLNLRRIGLVGAFSEKEEKLWRKSLTKHQVLDMFVPVARDREHLAHLTREELHLGIVNQTTRADLGRIVYSLRRAGARAIVLANPELTLGLSHLDPVLPVLDAVELHAISAVEWSLRTETGDGHFPRTTPREKRQINRANTQA